MAGKGGLGTEAETHIGRGQRPGLAVLAAHLAFPFAASLLLSGCSLARDILYMPLAHSAVPPQWVHGAPAVLEVMTSDERSVKGLYWPGAPEDPDIFVFFHGRHMNAETGAKFAQHLLGRGDAVLVGSYRGFGGNKGRPSEKRMMRDATAFIDEARALAGPQARIWLVGHSLGAAVALQAAANDNAEPPEARAIRGVFAISAFTRVSAAVPRLLRAFVPDRWDNMTALKQVRVPVIFFQGGLDKYIPAGSGAALMTAASPPALLLLGAQTPHNPDMTVLGPWISAAANDMALGGIEALSPPPSGWTKEAARP